MADGQPSPTSKVKFLDNYEDRTTAINATQKYDRKEIQKRLDVESWIDDQLRELYGAEVSRVCACV